MKRSRKEPCFVSAEEAVMHIPDGATLVNDGFIIANAAEEVLQALAKRYVETGHPRQLTLVHAAGQGNRIPGVGIDCLAHDGLLKRSIGGHWNMMTSLQRAAIEGRMEAYNLPQGVLSHMIRDAAAKRPGTIAKTGLYTFVDPRNGGGKLNANTREDIVELLTISGEECLLYKPLPVNVAIVRGTCADMHGNISVEEEAILSLGMYCAQAAHNNNGVVIVQVKEILHDRLLPANDVSIPGIYVDFVVQTTDIEKYHRQCNSCAFDASLCGQGGQAATPRTQQKMPLDERTVICRRAFKELKDGDVGNLGIGMPEGVATVAEEKGNIEKITLTIESGPIGGVSLAGLDFGCVRDYEARLDAAAQFNFYQGGGLDIAFLGLAQTDGKGNINVSKFGSVIAGCGGFIDISQHAKRVVFCGTFTAKGLVLAFEDGKLKILKEGSVRKFISEVEHITFSGEYAQMTGQYVLYVTERAVFKLTAEGVELIEYAPGIDIENDILAHMDFCPIIRNPVEMDSALFTF